MKTRDDLSEAKELIRVLSLYSALELRQVLALFPGRAESIRNLISRLVKQKRLYYMPESGVLAEYPEQTVNPCVISAFWVLLDVLDQVEYHTASDFPVAISFFTDADAFDIIVVPDGQENLISHALGYVQNDTLPKRIVVVDDPVQIPKLHINSVAGFCTVDSSGEVSYFQID